MANIYTVPFQHVLPHTPLSANAELFRNLLRRSARGQTFQKASGHD